MQVGYLYLLCNPVSSNVLKYALKVKLIAW